MISREEGRATSKPYGLLEGDLCCHAASLEEEGGRGKTSKQPLDF